VRFEWDDAKDRSNQKKHGLAFSEATELFQGTRDCLEIFDAAHSDAEDRFIAIGEIDRGSEPGSLPSESGSGTASTWTSTDE
jgi:uncharacterized DUF497 family protein